MESNSSSTNNSQAKYNNKYSNEKVKNYIQEFFEYEELWKSPEIDLIKQEYKQETLIEKYYCEEHYVEVVRCLDKAEYHSLNRCELALEDLGRCIFDRIKLENLKKK